MSERISHLIRGDKTMSSADVTQRAAIALSLVLRYGGFSVRSPRRDEQSGRVVGGPDPVVPDISGRRRS